MKLLYCILPMFLMSCMPFLIDDFDGYNEGQANQKAYIDGKCGGNMTSDWCRESYRRLEEAKQSEIDDIRPVQIIQPTHTIHCTTHKIYKNNTEMTCETY